MSDRWTLLTDYYQLNMMYGHLRNGTADTRVAFDLYYRENPFDNGYCVAAGLETAVHYLRALRFTPEDLDYVRSLGVYDDRFIAALGNLQFTGDVDAVPEGTVVFPGLPLLRVTARVFEAQLVETALLNIIGHQTLIATKAARIVQAAAGDKVLEFGLRRAHGPDAGLYGARASLIGGCTATSNVLAGQRFQVPIAGTNAHAWVQFFPTELEAFRAWATNGPAMFLVDTYDTLRSGLPNALTVARELVAAGGRFMGIRLDSGDLAYLSKQARTMMDEAGFTDAIIVASSDLDEHLIRELKAQGARIDMWGVGTNLITARDWPALGAVYKLAAVETPSGWSPRLKLSNNPAKVTNPGVKRALRIYDQGNGRAIADLLVLHDEVLDPAEPLVLFDPVHTWKKKRVRDYTVRELLMPIFRDGQLVYQLPHLSAIQAHARADLDTFWDEYKRLVNPEIYPVDLSLPLWTLRRDMIRAARAALALNGDGNSMNDDLSPAP